MNNKDLKQMMDQTNEARKAVAMILAQLSPELQLMTLMQAYADTAASICCANLKADPSKDASFIEEGIEIFAEGAREMSLDRVRIIRENILPKLKELGIIS